MSALPTALRGQLEKTVVKARNEAEGAARAALTRLSVEAVEPSALLSAEEKVLRRKLRAEASRLGSFDALVSEVGYQHWHRMLFARFLAENGLLMHPEGVAVTLDDCRDLATEEGDADAWATASRYAAGMLPGIFRESDPTLLVRFAPEGRQALEALLSSLPAAVFTADDALGWVYQFWQTQAKKEVNESQRKVGGADISPVTQLFTEHYMVQFLLHNSLGAWWTARHPETPLPTDKSYLRTLPPVSPDPNNGEPEGIGSPLLGRGGNSLPAAGTFEGWPKTTKELRVLDPCCGSGHFLVASFALLTRFRMLEENLSEAEAGDAVLRENLFGLELDPRCTQIAAFALALAAWKSGGYRALPVPNIACSGLPVGNRLHEWQNLADKAKVESEQSRVELKATLTDLYHLFQQAPDLGSLIDPAQALQSGGATSFGNLYQLDWSTVAPLLEKALAKGDDTEDPAAGIFGEAARGVAKAADLLGRKYHLVITNVPYLKAGNQDSILKDYCEVHYPDAKADLATVFLRRCLTFCHTGGTVSLVTPQNWLFLGRYKALRSSLLIMKSWNLVAKLGTNAFETISGEVVNVALITISNSRPHETLAFYGADATSQKSFNEKARFLETVQFEPFLQNKQLDNPDCRIAFEDVSTGKLLEQYARGNGGMRTGDYPSFGRCFWEIDRVAYGWIFQQSTVDKTQGFCGMEHIVLWENAQGRYFEYVQEQARNGYHSGVWKAGCQVWGQNGVLVSQMGELPVSLYTGEAFDNNTSAIVPKDSSLLPAIWCFCSSPEFNTAVRRIDQALKVTNASLVKVPFDLAHWQKVAEEKYPDGLPKPFSSDPTQWLFNGHPYGSDDPLQVAVARLLGYRWPRQTMDPADTNEQTGMVPVSPDGLEAFADTDGIVCLPAVAGEDTAAERLRALLAAAFGGDGEAATAWIATLTGGKSLAEWLANDFFAAHCKRFHNRPFIWHLWDGRKDGFSVLVNYHTLDRAKLEKLIYVTLGDWITAQKRDDDSGVAGAGARLAAAVELKAKLEAILTGEPPYDIYIRWKPLAQQPLGWDPDLNDGVRLNIRPFLTAEVLRNKSFKIKMGIDRGTNPDGTARDNDKHYTLAEKRMERGL